MSFEMRGRYPPSMDNWMKLRTALGHSLPHSSTSISPAVVSTMTLPLVTG